MEKEIVWSIDTTKFSERELEKLAKSISIYDSPIAVAISSNLKSRRIAIKESKRSEKLVALEKEHQIAKALREKGTDSRGRNFKWTAKVVREVAKAYSTRTEFAKGTPGAYSFARGTGIIEELFPIEKDI